jgi:CheY-like chemotaxis protein/HPt (histidine-containing phosphotransfer) domain-containing protein
MSRPRVLVADDNPLSLTFFLEALQTLGCAGESAADGAEALTHARASAFDLLLLDVRMPRLGGAEVLALVRADPGPSQATVAVATTAAAEPPAGLLAAGFAEVLHKPVDLAGLQRVLARHLPLPTADCAVPAFDDAQALAAAGGDAAIVAALRGLLAAELDALPVEITAIDAARDAAALHERLHRLDASAGFCGVPALGDAGSRLRAALAAGEWPQSAIAQFLRRCGEVRALLA